MSICKVLPIPGAEHHINIPPDVIFPKKVPHQKPLSDSQCTYLNKAVDKLLAADIVKTICPEDIKCCSPITLAQKPHNTPGLSLNELQHRVNEECISHNMTPVHNIEPCKPQLPTHPPVPLDPPKPQTWHICQNYSALNRVTQVFSTPTRDICTKQRKLSGYRWIHKFDFASGFYAIFVPAPMRPYLAFYTESGGF